MPPQDQNNTNLDSSADNQDNTQPYIQPNADYADRQIIEPSGQQVSSEPILDQPVVEPVQQPSGPANESNEPAEIIGNSSLESSETTSMQDIPQDNDTNLTASEPTDSAPLELQNQPTSSPERVSLTDLSSYQPQNNTEISNGMAQASQPMPDSAAKENIYTEICSQIIREQEQIIGALAVEQAQQVVGLTVDPVTYHCTVMGDGSKVIDDLIEQYRDFFGHAAVEVCKEAASKFVSKLPTDALPASLR